MKIVNKVLLDLAGNEIKAGDTPMTVANVLMNCALAPRPEAEQGKEADIPSSKEATERYELAVMLGKTGVGESFDLTLDQIATLDKDLRRIYTTIVSGQVLSIINGKTLN
jgi:hypothetical protein